MKNKLWQGALLFCSVTWLQAQTNPASKLVRFESREQRTSLLELYTSEGCSSCPSAEAWLSRLYDSPGLWKDFVPVAFHVDYWDRLGWPDRWASRDYSDRQRAYAKTWRKDTVYTPGFVLDGHEWRDWAARKEVPATPAATPGVLKVASADAIRWRVDFIPASQTKTAYSIHGALLASGIQSDVKAGENRGQHLTHDFVVLTTTAEALTNNEDVFQGEFMLNRKSRQKSGRLALAVWLTLKGKAEPLQATGGWLEVQKSK